MIPELLLNVKPCPPSGEGVHRFIFHAACRAIEAGMKDEQAIESIEAMMTRPPNPASEVEDALRSARGERSGPRVLWPPVNREQIEAITHDNANILDLWRSWRRVRSQESHAEEIIDRLFPGNPCLCEGKTNR